MHLRIQRMTVRSPIGAEDEHNVIFARLRTRNRRGNVAVRIRLLVVYGMGGMFWGAAYDQ